MLPMDIEQVAFMVMLPPMLPPPIEEEVTVIWQLIVPLMFPDDDITPCIVPVNVPDILIPIELLIWKVPDT